MNDYYSNKYRKLKKGVKPPIDARKYTLSNIKYVVEHQLYDPANELLNRSIIGYLGNTFKDFLGV